MKRPKEGFRQDYSCKERGGSLLVEGRNGAFRGGFIVTPDGIVGVYDQGGDTPYTAFDVARDGRNYSISWDRTFTDRGLKTLAKRFAADVAARVRDQQP